MNPTLLSRVGAALLLFCIAVCSATRGGEAYALASPLSVEEYAGVFEGDGATPLHYRLTVIGSELPGNYALIIFFHGISERGSDNEKQVTLAYGPLLRYCVANRVKAVLLFPQCPKRKLWARVAPPTADLPLAPAPTAPMASAMWLLAEKIGMYNPDRVYAVGVSMGGYGVWDLLSRCPAMVSGAVIICGGGDVDQAWKLRHIPIHVVHGTQDAIVPVARSRSMARAIWNAGGDEIVYKELPQGGHEVWNDVFEEPATWEWLFSQQGATGNARR